MHSIGNDIIDLNLAKNQSNWQRTGFLEKQFTKNEQEQIYSSKNPFLKVWLFWSMKEAAYKCYTQQFKTRFFAPLKFECQLVSNTSGFVKINDEVYSSETEVTAAYIHTIALKNKNFKGTIAVFKNENIQTSSIFLNRQIASLFSEKISVFKNEFGIPELYQKEKKLPFSISKSHHGNYASYALLKHL